MRVNAKYINSIRGYSHVAYDKYKVHKLHQRMPLVEFMYLLFTRMPCENYRRRLGSLLFVFVTSFERKLTPLCVDSARALWASFCFTRCLRIQLVFLVFAVNLMCTYTICVSCFHCKLLVYLHNLCFLFSL